MTGRGMVRRETGKEKWMKEPYAEGVANHGGPESCAAVRKGSREAWTGVCVGRVLSREIALVRAPTLSSQAEGNTLRSDFASSAAARAVGDPSHAQNLFAREPGGPLAARGGWCRGPHREGVRP